MSLPAIFENFVQQSPVTVMMRGILERVMSPEKLDQLFEQTAENQYTRELLFSEVVELMMPVVTGRRRSVYASYLAKKEQLSVSGTSVYNKINGIEAKVSAELVRHSAAQLQPILKQRGTRKPELVPGYRVKICDGNALSGTEHRLLVLRDTKAGALPGKSLVVLDPVSMLAIDLFPCEDGHAQERSLFTAVLETVEANDLWIADRNFCVLCFLGGIAKRKAAFVIREHASLSQKPVSTLCRVGEIETGEVWEQMVMIEYGGQELKIRRVVVRLNQPTRDGDTEISVLTNLPETLADGLLVASLYGGRSTVETFFQVVTINFNCEIKSLGYPRAALFSFAMALFAYNALSLLITALSTVHGVGKIEAGLSNYYLAEEITMTYRGMMIAIPPDHWCIFSRMRTEQFWLTLQDLAAQVRLSAFVSHPRGPKKKKKKPHYDPKHPHVSTARLLGRKKKTS